ncbi:MAG: hypothetical protein QM703_03720 [Gemmatales bacterium]
MTYTRAIHSLAWVMVFAWSVYAFRVATDEQHHEWVTSDVGWQWMLGAHWSRVNWPKAIP